MLMDEMFLQKLDVARDISRVKFKINSGFRCIRHDKEERNGKPGGSHPKGIAVDIKTLTSRHRYKILVALLKVGFHRIGIEKDFIHVDDDTIKSPQVIWIYERK
jgi:hypothetical protein